MSPSSLTRAQAAGRSRALRDLRGRIRLDLSRASDPAEPRFPVRADWELTVAEPGLAFLEFAGDVDAVVVDGRDQPVAERFRDGRIGLEDLTAGPHRVEVAGHGRYSRSGEGLHRYQDPQDQAVYLYTQYEPADAHRVYPCADQPDLRAQWSFEIAAPAAWEVAVNTAPAGPAEAADGVVVHRFEPSLPIPAYLTCVLAGPYHRTDATWTGTAAGREQTLELPLYCRASMAEHLDEEAIRTVTRQGLDFFTDLFDSAYPFPRYAQAFVPEYNLGAMENPGLVTFTEDLLFPDGATRAQLTGRATTILHEMAHMWFGDLVALSWWDQLWLKESFAEFMGEHAAVEATEFTGAWVSFALRRKAWARRQDALPTTHPIVADVPDTAAAQQNFDGITYAKGASALRQLVSFVGLEPFTQACRAYFREHAWGSASLEDLLAALEQVTDLDVRAWARDWLETTGASRLAVETVRDDDGALSSARLVPGADRQVPHGRPHRMQVTVHDPRTGEPVASERVLVGGEPVELRELSGARGVLVVDALDETYAELVLDEPTRTGLLHGLSALQEPITRAAAWAQLWQEVREQRLDPGDFVDAVQRHLLDQSDAAVLDAVLGFAVTAVEACLPARRRPEVRRQLGDAIEQRLRGAAAGSDRQAVLARVLAQLAARDGSRAGLLHDLLDGQERLEGLPLGSGLRWSMLTALVATNRALGSAVVKEADRDPSRTGAAGRARALAARPTDRAKAEAWELMLGGTLSNDLLSATAQGFQLGDEALIAPYRDQYFAGLEQQWQEHSIGMATRLIRGLFPGDSDLRPGTAPEEDEVLRRTDAWLHEHPDAPAALRRILREERDHLHRRLRVQAAARP